MKDLQNKTNYVSEYAQQIALIMVKVYVIVLTVLRETKKVLVFLFVTNFKSMSMEYVNVFLHTIESMVLVNVVLVAQSSLKNVVFLYVALMKFLMNKHRNVGVGKDLGNFRRDVLFALIHIL